jgi:hypothetical protein
MEFDEERPNLWESLFKAVIASQSYEHQVFKTNLDKRISENIAEMGFDPRIQGPPDHIVDQKVANKDDLDDY